MKTSTGAIAVIQVVSEYRIMVRVDHEEETPRNDVNQLIRDTAIKQWEEDGKKYADVIQEDIPYVTDYYITSEINFEE